MAFAVFFMGTHQRANEREGIVLKQKLPCFLNVAIQKEANHLRDGSVDGTARAAFGLFAFKTAGGKLDDGLVHRGLLGVKTRINLSEA
jgi:hypothetical protein